MESVSQENVVISSYGLNTSQKVGLKTLDETLNDCKKRILNPLTSS